MLISSGAFAQDTGEQAFQAYVDGLEALGIEVENGAVSYDQNSDTLTVKSSTLTFSGKIADLPPKEKDLTAKDESAQTEPAKPRDLDYLISMSSGELTIVGLAHEDGDFEAESWTYSNDTQLVMTASVENEGRLTADGRLAGMYATNYSFTMPEIPAEDATHPVSRWLPFFQTALLASYDEVTIENTGVTFEAYANQDGTETQVASGSMQMDGYRITNVEDGKVGEYTIDLVIQEFQTLDPASGQMLNQTTRQGKTHYEDIDMAAMFDLFDPDVPETGDTYTLVRTGSTVDYESTQEVAPGLAIKMAVDKASITEITLTKRDNDFLALFDDLLNKKAPSPDQLITGIFQLYRAFAVADARISGISIGIPTPGPKDDIDLTIKEMAMTDVSSDGIGEMLVVGLEAPKLPDGGSAKLEWAAIGDIEFADYAPMRSMISTLMADPNYAENHMIDVARAFLPRSFSYEVEGLDVDIPEVGRTQIGKAELNLSTTVPPVPTSFYLKNDGIRIPISSIEDQDAQAFLQVLGLETVVWSDETRLYWDEATLELRLERLMLDIEGLGTAEASARFANVPKEFFEDPEGQGQMAAVVAQFVDATVVYKDSGLAGKGVSHIAELQGVPDNVFREALVAQAAGATAILQNEAFTKMVSEAASKFLKEPGELRLTLKPENPVPMATIIGSLAAAPQTLPDLLSVSVEAN